MRCYNFFGKTKNFLGKLKITLAFFEMFVYNVFL